MKDLRCYAYWDNFDGVQCRYGTILVGKKDEFIVGNCIMKNPGSASPMDSLFVRDDGRKEFSIDATMHAITELFEIDKDGGAVRIWNLSDVREPDFAKAKNIIRQVDDISLFNNHCPTYIGWGDFWKDDSVCGRAQVLFDMVQPNNGYLNPKIDKNPFFHPLYLMRYGSNKIECREIIESFRAKI